MRRALSLNPSAVAAASAPPLLRAPAEGGARRHRFACPRGLGRLGGAGRCSLSLRQFRGRHDADHERRACLWPRRTVGGGGGGMGGSSNGSTSGSGHVNVTLAMGLTGGLGRRRRHRDRRTRITHRPPPRGWSHRPPGPSIGGASGLAAAARSWHPPRIPRAVRPTRAAFRSAAAAAGAARVVTSRSKCDGHHTLGAFAPAVLAQSISGGGGVASGRPASPATSPTAADAVSRRVQRPRRERRNGDGGQLQSGCHIRRGFPWHRRQSIAGGGGLGGSRLSGNGNTALTPPADGHPGAGSESGGGGQVTLQAGSSVQTTGNRAIAIIAQSIAAAACRRYSDRDPCPTPPSAAPSPSVAQGEAMAPPCPLRPSMARPFPPLAAWPTPSLRSRLAAAVASPPCRAVCWCWWEFGGLRRECHRHHLQQRKTSGAAAIASSPNPIGGGGGVGHAASEVNFEGTSGDGGSVTVNVNASLTTSGTNAVVFWRSPSAAAAALG